MLRSKGIKKRDHRWVLVDHTVNGNMNWPLSDLFVL